MGAQRRLLYRRPVWTSRLRPPLSHLLRDPAHSSQPVSRQRFRGANTRPPMRVPCSRARCSQRWRCGRRLKSRTWTRPPTRPGLLRFLRVERMRAIVRSRPVEQLTSIYRLRFELAPSRRLVATFFRSSQMSIVTRLMRKARAATSAFDSSCIRG